MAEAIVEILKVWHEEGTECQPCSLCEETIYSVVHRLCIHIGDKIEETKIVLCNSCKDAVQQQD